MSVDSRRAASLPDSDVFHILGNDRRRAIITTIAGTGEAVDVSTLAQDIATAESGERPPPSKQYKSVYVSLQQTHLPQLQEDDVVEYDPESKLVRPGRRFDQVVTYLNDDRSGRADRDDLLVLISAVGIALVLLASVNVPMISTLAPHLWGVLALLCVAVVCLSDLAA